MAYRICCQSRLTGDYYNTVSCEGVVVVDSVEEAEKKCQYLDGVLPYWRHYFVKEIK